MQSPDMAVDVRWGHERVLTRNWQVRPWAYLPPSLQPGFICVPTTQGLPSSIAKGMQRRGCEFTGFPYPRLAGLSREYRWRAVETVTMENDRYRMVLAIRMGPRIIEIHDKQAGAPLVLPMTQANTALFGLTGAWFPGGVEFNPFRLGHTVFFDQALPTDEVVFEDGQRGVRVSGHDEWLDMRFAILFRLEPNGVAWRVEVENLLPREQPLYWYTNIAIPAHERTFLMFEPGSAAINHALDPGFRRERWPKLCGGSAERWGLQADMISAYFYRYRRPFMGFFEPRYGTAVAHYAPIQALKGRKLWSLGARPHTAHWYPRIYEPGLDNYCEIQAGISPMQMMFASIGPRRRIGWTEMLTSFPFREHSSYAAAWRAFCAAAVSRVAVRSSQKEGLAWQVRESRNVIPISLRQQSAADAARTAVDGGSMAKLTGDELLGDGWRAGPGWLPVLRRVCQREGAGDLVRLQFAVNLIGTCRWREAEGVLAVVRGKTPPLAALRERLFSALRRRVGRWSDAVRHACRAVRHAPDDVVCRREALMCCRLAGDMRRRQRLLAECPPSLRRMDEIRHEAALFYFERGVFDRAIRELRADFPDVGEGMDDAWNLWRECWIAWALREWQAGRRDRASGLLLKACEDAPQFGIGRRPMDANEVPCFYRWWLARALGDSMMESALADQLMRRYPHPSSEQAMYLWRLAACIGHASAARRARSIRNWWREERRLGNAAPAWKSILERCITGKNANLCWRRVGSNDMLWYRAQFEIRNMLK